MRQQFRLQQQGEFADLIEKKTCPPWACSSNPDRRESAPVNARALVTEEFAFQQFFGIAPQSTAKTGIRATTAIMNGPGDKLFAGSGFAEDQHIDIGSRHLFDAVKTFCIAGPLPTKSADGRIDPRSVDSSGASTLALNGRCNLLPRVD